MFCSRNSIIALLFSTTSYSTSRFASTAAASGFLISNKNLASIPRHSAFMKMSSSTSDTSIADALEQVRARVKDASLSVGKGENDVRLVAVSKTKPVELLMECYKSGQRRFGENYAQELTSKAETMPDDVEWHFIGSLQSNKAAPLVKKVGTRLKVVETVSSKKLADKLDRAVVEVRKQLDNSDDYKLGIYIQVNTSMEESKSGVEAKDAASLAKDIAESCPHLSLEGLMTIGAPGDFDCFDRLVDCRKEVAKSLGIVEEDLELSMGMSGDFEEAIRRGATNVRVGSTIFGARDYSTLK